jgi:hypothetical protein
VTDSPVLTFLPWAAPASAVLPRTIPATGPATVTLSATALATAGSTRQQSASVSLSLLGPGDVTGLASGQVLRTDPADDATGVETTLFPCVELVLPHLPWLFTDGAVTGAAGAGSHVMPWLCLVVVPDSAQVTVNTQYQLLTAPAAELPDLSEAWAWAHVQYSAALPGTDATGAGTVTAQTVTQLLTSGSQAPALARLLCARVLAANTRYHACVVPTTTAGQAAGLGLPPSTAKITYSWPAGDKVTLPYYHYFSFTTGDDGDFKSLASRLAASGQSISPADLQPGSLTVTWPSGPAPFTSTMPTVLSPVTPASSGTTTSAAGPPGPVATAPSTAASAVSTAVPADLATWLTTQYAPSPSTSPPVLNAPAYGAAQAPTTPSALATGSGQVAAWLSELNTDPRLRIAAGYGAQIVAADREKLTAAAFDQAGALTGVNAQLDRGQLGRAVRTRAVQRHLTGHDPLTTVQLLSPVAARLALSLAATPTAPPATIASITDDPDSASDPRLGPAASAAYRRATRPRGTPARHAGVPTGITVPAELAPTALLAPMSPQPAVADDRILQEHVTPDTLTLAGQNHDTLRQLAPGVDFSTPMLSRLIAFNPQAVMPAAEAIPANTALFLTGDPTVIVAFLVGLNWAAQRLLQWRDVPTDRQWTSFRWFWGSGAEEIHQISAGSSTSGWSSTSALADQLVGGQKVVLAIRSDLFRRYPRSCVYLVPANATAPRFTLTADNAKLPAYSELMPPDLRLLVFDVTSQQLTTPPGYFVVFQEQVSETRFGTDPLPAAGPGANARYWPVPALTSGPAPANSADVADLTRMAPALVAIAADRLFGASGGGQQ